MCSEGSGDRSLERGVHEWLVSGSAPRPVLMTRRAGPRVLVALVTVALGNSSRRDTHATTATERPRVRRPPSLARSPERRSLRLLALLQRPSRRAPLPHIHLVPLPSRLLLPAPRPTRSRILFVFTCLSCPTAEAGVPARERANDTDNPAPRPFSRASSSRRRRDQPPGPSPGGLYRDSAALESPRTLMI